jgi:hypothetical protein
VATSSECIVRTRPGHNGVQSRRSPRGSGNDSKPEGPKRRTLIPASGILSGFVVRIDRLGQAAAEPRSESHNSMASLMTGTLCSCGSRRGGATQAELGVRAGHRQVLLDQVPAEIGEVQIP